MRSTKRRVSSSDVQSSSTSYKTTTRSVTVTKKVLDEKENFLRREKTDKRKALNERQNLSELLREDYFDSGSYRAENIGKPWRSPNLSRRGIHSSYEGSVKSCSGSGEVISSTSYQSTSLSRGNRTSCELQDEDAYQSNIELNRLQTTSETNHISNSSANMRTRAMRLSEQRENERFCSDDFMGSISTNSNNNAAQKRGARRITMWKANSINDDEVEENLIVQRKSHAQGGTSQISMFGFDKEDNNSTKSRVTRSQSHRLKEDGSLQSHSTHTSRQSSVSISTTIYHWIHTSVFVTVLRKSLSSVEYMRAATGAPYWPLAPLYAGFAIFRWLYYSTVHVISSGLQRLGLLGSKSSIRKTEESKTAVITKAARSRRRPICCTCPWLCLFLLLPLLLLSSVLLTDDNTNGQARSALVKHCSAMASWTADRLLSIPQLLFGVLVSIKNGILVLFLSRDTTSLPLDPPVNTKQAAGKVDGSTYAAIMKALRLHGDRLAAQEKELKSQKALLESLAAYDKTSDKKTTNLATQINRWESDLKSMRQQLSSFDATLVELKNLKFSSSGSKASGGSVSSKELLLLSKQVESLTAQQQKQKDFSEELNNLRALLLKLETHVKEQKEWTILELKKHEKEVQTLSVSFTKGGGGGSGSGGDSAALSTAFKTLSDKVMADHDRLAAFETQQKSLTALIADLEKRMGSHTVSTQSKDSRTPVQQTDASLTGITAKLQTLEAEQKALSSRLDKMGTTASSSVKVDSGGKGCAGVQELIDRALAIFAADRIARPDFALESAGGSIIGTRCTQTYTDRPAVFSLFGIPLFRMSRSPRTVIQPALYPGECWAFRGSKGQLVVRLASNIEITAITLEHVPKSLAPNGKISSAPQKFVVKGLASEADYKGVQLGEFEYLDNDQPLQTFDLMPPYKVFRYIELQILSNHGHAEYTCVYRVRVHGKIDGDKESDTEVR